MRTAGRPPQCQKCKLLLSLWGHLVPKMWHKQEHTHTHVLLDFAVKPEHFLTGFERFSLTSETDRQGKRPAVIVTVFLRFLASFLASYLVFQFYTLIITNLLLSKTVEEQKNILLNEWRNGDVELLVHQRQLCQNCLPHKHNETAVRCKMFWQKCRAHQNNRINRLKMTFHLYCLLTETDFWVTEVCWAQQSTAIARARDKGRICHRESAVMCTVKTVCAIWQLRRQSKQHI